MKKVLCVLIAMFIGLGLSFGIWCGIVKILSLCFGFAFSFKIVIGAMLISSIIKVLARGNKTC